MILWHVKIDKFDYDDYDAFVVCAPDEAGARALVYQVLNTNQVEDFTNAPFNQIGVAFNGHDATTRIICHSFNAG